MDVTDKVYFFTLGIPQKQLYSVYMFMMFSFVVAAPLIRTVINAVIGREKQW